MVKKNFEEILERWMRIWKRRKRRKKLVVAGGRQKRKI